MPTYEYKIKKTGEIVEVIQTISEKPLKKVYSKKKKRKMAAERLISGGAGVIFEGVDFQTNLKNRGYKGKFTEKIRPTGTPVDAPANKSEADMQFQKWVDTGGLEGIKPTMNLKSKPQTAEQMVDKKYNPNNK